MKSLDLSYLLHSEPDPELVQRERAAWRRDTIEARKDDWDIARLRYCAAEGLSQAAYAAFRLAELYGEGTNVESLRRQWHLLDDKRRLAQFDKMLLPAPTIAALREKEKLAAFMRQYPASFEIFSNVLARDREFFARELAQLKNRKPRGSRTFDGQCRRID